MSLNLPVSAPPNLVLAMPILFPNAFRLVDWDVDGDQVTVWNLGDSLPTDAQIAAAVATVEWAAFQVTVQAAIDITDTMAIRCIKSGIALPENWVAYYTQLLVLHRSISGDPTQALPSVPAKPAGLL